MLNYQRVHAERLMRLISMPHWGYLFAAKIKVDQQTALNLRSLHAMRRGKQLWFPALVRMAKDEVREWCLLVRNDWRTKRFSAWEFQSMMNMHEIPTRYVRKWCDCGLKCRTKRPSDLCRLAGTLWYKFLTWGHVGPISLHSCIYLIFNTFFCSTHFWLDFRSLWLLMLPWITKVRVCPPRQVFTFVPRYFPSFPGKVRSVLSLQSTQSGNRSKVAQLLSFGENARKHTSLKWACIYIYLCLLDLLRVQVWQSSDQAVGLLCNHSQPCFAVDDFGMIVNEKHVDRLENLIQTVTW